MVHNLKIVISLGGKVLTKSLEGKHFKKYADVLRKLKGKGHRVIVITGGGYICRTYQAIARELHASKAALDSIGIIATRLNAATLMACLGDDAYPTVLTSAEQVKVNADARILVCAGNEIGHSTDFDSSIIAEIVDADILINATNVNGVYSSDPKKNPKAKKLNKLSYDEFQKIVIGVSQEPGDYDLFDLAAVQIIKRSKIKTVIIDASDPEEIVRAVEGKHDGTVIG